ncbi:nucleotidyltransferase domain-containing protein [bacterium]|nr:nucleotidyltransferase domain-containing protein [bacterium]
MIRDKFNELINIIFEKTKDFYKDNLISFIVFGSCGRDTPTNESDIDILIILNEINFNRMKRMKIFYENVEKKIENEIKNYEKYNINTYISPIIRSKEEVKYGSPLYIEMILGVKIIYDKDNFFKNYLKRLENKLNKLKSSKKNGYWIFLYQLKNILKKMQSRL